MFLKIKPIPQVEHLTWVGSIDPATPCKWDSERLRFSRELWLKFLYPTSSINKSFFPGVSRVRIHSHISHQQMVINPLDVFGLFGSGGRLRYELFASWDINKTNRVESGVYIFFHNLSLPGLKTRVCFVNDIESAPTANYLAVRVSVFECFNGWNYFHGFYNKHLMRFVKS